MPLLWIAVAVSLMCAFPIDAQAQEDDEPLGYSYVTYYMCDVANQGNMDNIIEANEKAVFDKWVKDGKLLGWGYLSHFTGGRWRRAQYHVSATLDEALVNQATIFREIYSANRDGAQARAEACKAHDDYVWAMKLGSEPGTDRGDASLSVYFICDIARQRRADEIFADLFAPQLDAMAEAGEIASWSWQGHILGGEYQRLQTITGRDHATVVNARMRTLQRAGSTNQQLAGEFASICNSHTDYLWDIVH